MVDPEVQERIAVRRAELDDLEEQLVKQLAEVRSEREDLAAAERVLARMGEQIAAERAASAPTAAQVGGKAVLLIPHRVPDVDETALPPEYQRILAAVRDTGGPVTVRQIGETLGLDTEVRGQVGAAARETDQAGRSRLAAQASRRAVHPPPVRREPVNRGVTAVPPGLVPSRTASVSGPGRSPRGSLRRHR